jgi:hypothetical protein
MIGIYAQVGEQQLFSARVMASAGWSAVTNTASIVARALGSSNFKILPTPNHPNHCICGGCRKAQGLCDADLKGAKRVQKR